MIEQVQSALLQEWIHQSGQTVKSVITRGSCLDQADSEGGEDRTQWDAGSEGYRLSDCVH